ncbi:MAG: dockerin type I domain-containing protein, partial [Planctomycetota bacterium]
LDITCELGTVAATHTFVNVTGTALAYETYIRIPADKEPAAVTQNGVPVAYTYEETAGRVHVTGDLDTGVSAVTVVRVSFAGLGDMNCDGNVNAYDIDGFICALSPQCDYEGQYPDCDRQLADCNGDGDVNAYDIDSFIALVGGG